MATVDETLEALRDFLLDSFRAPELEMFLTLNGYKEVVSAVNPNVGGMEYVFNVVRAMDHRRLIEDAFFVRLGKERPARAAEIESLAGSWAVVDRGALAASEHDVVYRSIARRYPSLRDHAIDFGNDLAVADRFVGRAELFQRLADFAAQRPCGYFRVVADAGLGKTALAAETARRLKAPAFFANASRGLTRPDQCLNHLAVELIARFGLDHDHLPARAGEDSTFLGQVLAEAAAKAEGPLWIVVNALDEADPSGPGRNPLLLSDRLPRGVYMLLTHRPGPVALATAAGTANEEYRIAAADAAQQADIEVYLRREADRPEIRRAREAADLPIATDRFVAFLKEKSEGNFKYLDYVLADIVTRQPGFDPLDLDALPSGLRGYYQQFWSQMEQVRGQEGWAEWQGLYRPTIAFLAAAREAVPASWLGAMIGRPAEEIEERALKRWRRFLGQESKGESERWRVVHQSFVDFLAKERKGDLRAAHDRVASFYLSAWGGLDADLPALFDAERSEELDGYGLRHLAEHLERAGRIDNLHRLLRLERRSSGEVGPVRPANAWYTVRERVGQTEGYMNDLARAARLVQIDDRPDVEPGQLKAHIALGIRYALMSTSLHNLARNIPPSLIAALVEKRLWLASQGLAYARVLAPEARIDALIGISSHLDHKEKEAVLREALDTTRGIRSEGARAHALARLAPRLADAGRVDDALALARGIGHESARALALAALGQLEEALTVARGIGSEGARAHVMAELAPRLKDAGRVEEALTLVREIGLAGARAHALAALGQLEEALVASRGIGAERARARALARLAPRIAEAGRVEETMAPHLAEASRIEEMLAVTRRIGDELARARALAKLAPRLVELGRAEEALAVARGIGSEAARARALAVLGRTEESIAVARGIGDESARARALAALAPRLADAGLVGESIALAREISDESARARALAALAPRLAKAGRIEEALTVLRGIRSEGSRARALAELAPSLSVLGQVREAMAAARGIGSERARARALAALVPRLAQAGRIEEALEAARGIVPAGARARALADLGQFEEALAVARGIGSPAASARALAALAPRLAALGQLEEALAVARGIGSELDRASALAMLAPRVAEVGRVEEALEIARGIASEWLRTRALMALASHVAALPRAKAVPLWSETLRHSAARPRRDLLADLIALAPVIAALGGPEAIAETCRAIENVGRWWP